MTGLIIDKYMNFGGYPFLQCKKGECVGKFVQFNWSDSAVSSG